MRKREGEVAEKGEAEEGHHGYRSCMLFMRTRTSAYYYF